LLILLTKNAGSSLRCNVAGIWGWGEGADDNKREMKNTKADIIIIFFFFH